MKVTKVGVFIRKDHLTRSSIRDFIECCIIYNDDNMLNMGEGFHIDAELTVGEVKGEHLKDLKAIACTWGYAQEFDINDLKSKEDFYTTICDVDNMSDDDYFILMTLYEQDILEGEFQININDKEASLVYTTSGDIVASLIEKFNLYPDSERREHLLNLCGKPMDTYFSGDRIEKKLEDGKVRVTLIIDRELAKYLVSLM